MLIFAALMLCAVAALHSFVAGKRLINGICALLDLPIILGSR